MIFTRKRELKLIKPRALRTGDKVGLIAPGSRPASAAVVARGQRLVSEMGFEPVVGEHVLDAYGFMAGSDTQRLNDFRKFIDDDSIAAIFCITGGYGALHLAPYLDYAAVAAKPKLIVGCDDNTILLNAIHSLTGLVCLDGPNLDQINNKETLDRFRDAVRCDGIMPALGAADSDKSRLFSSDFYSPVEGTVEGRLVGGNLTALCSLLGTTFEPQFQDSILFLDDIDEPTGILDRWFTSLYLAGHLHSVRGVAFGAFEGCGPKNSFNMLGVIDTFSDRLKYLSKPSCFGLPFGQRSSTNLMPIGIQVRLDCASGRLEFLENALSGG